MEIILSIEREGTHPVFRRRLAWLILVVLMPALITGCCCVGGGFNSFQSPGAAPARGALEGAPRLHTASAGIDSTEPMNGIPAHHL